MRNILCLLLLGCTFISHSQTLSEKIQSSNSSWDAGNYEIAFTELSQAVEVAKVNYEADPKSHAGDYAFVLNLMGVRLFEAESFETAASYYSAAINLYEKLQGENGEDYLVAVENLATCYNSSGNYSEAFRLFNYLLNNDTYKKAAGSQLFQTYNSAGILAYQIDNYEAAKTCYQNALSYLNSTSDDYWVIQENLIVLENSSGHYDLAYNLLVPFIDKYPSRKSEYTNVIAYHFRDLGLAKYNEGKLAESIPLYQQALTHFEPSDSIAKLSIVYAHQDLAAAFSNSGNFADGFPHLLKNLDVVKEYYGDTSTDYVFALNYLSLAASELGNYDAASNYYRKAYKAIDRLESDEQGELRALFDLNFSDYQLKIGRYEEAKSYAKRGYEFYASDEEKYFDDLVYAMNQVAILMITEGEYDKAESLLKTALKAQLDKNGIENEMGTKIGTNMTSLYIQSGRYSRAFQFLDFILANDLKIHGEQSSEYAFSLQVAGVLYLSSGLYNQAIDVLNKAYLIRRKFVGEQNRELLRLRQSLGTAYLKAGDYDKAEELLKAILELQQSSIGKDNFDYTLTINDLGMVYLAKGNYKDAARLFQSSYDYRKKLLGPLNQFTIASQYNLACTYLLQGDNAKAFDYFQQSTNNYIFGLNEYFPFLSEKNDLSFFIQSRANSTRINHS